MEGEALNFKDVNDFDTTIYYATPNESTLLWRELLKTTPIYRAAGICSAGEVGLFSMLPLVRQELVLVDHSYKSLHIAMLKYTILKDKGAKETYRLFTAASKEELGAVLEEAKTKLPPRVGSAFSVPGEWGQVTHPLNHSSEIKGAWSQLPQSLVRKASPKLGYVKFLHGDLTDLVKEGPFGLLYLSNALDHTSRTRDCPILDQVTACVKPGGYVVLCYYPNSWKDDRYKKIGWELVDSKAQSNYGWKQCLYKLPGKAEA